MFDGTEGHFNLRCVWCSSLCLNNKRTCSSQTNRISYEYVRLFHRRETDPCGKCADCSLSSTLCGITTPKTVSNLDASRDRKRQQNSRSFVRTEQPSSKRLSRSPLRIAQSFVWLVQQKRVLGGLETTPYSTRRQSPRILLERNAHIYNPISS